MQFDKKGNLYPYTLIETDIIAFEKQFVTEFATSVTRRILFEQYSQYLKRFQQEITANFCHWIDGSFITQKLTS
jgi:hypothetical protein